MSEVGKTIDALMPGRIVNEDATAGTLHIKGTANDHRRVAGYLVKLDSVGAAGVGPSDGPGDSKAAVAARKAVELQLELDNARRQYGENHPKVRELKRQRATSNQIATGVPTEPVYKGRPLSHWEGILKYEVDRNEMTTAAAAVARLIQFAPADKRVELTTRYLDVEATQPWVTGRADVFRVQVARSRTPELQMWLQQEAGRQAFQKQLIQCLNDKQLVNGAIFLMAIARDHIRKHPDVWESSQAAAWENRAAVHPFASLSLGFALNENQAARTLMQIAERNTDSAGTLVRILDTAEGLDLPIPREDLIRVAGHAQLREDSPLKIGRPFYSGPAAARTKEELRELEIFLTPTLDKAETYYKDGWGSGTIWSELEFLQSMIARGLVAGPVEERVASVLELALRGWREHTAQSDQVNPSDDLQFTTTVRSIIQLTGQLPGNVVAPDDAKLPPSLLALRRATRRSQVKLAQSVGNQYPIETLLACESIMKQVPENQKGLTPPLYLVEDPLVVWAAVMSSEVKLPEFEWYLLSSSDVSVYRSQLLEAVQAHPNFARNFYAWLDSSETADACYGRVGLLSDMRAVSDDALKYVESKLSNPTALHWYGAATKVADTWLSNGLCEGEQAVRLAKAAGKARGVFFAANHFAERTELDGYLSDSAVSFLELAVRSEEVAAEMKRLGIRRDGVDSHVAHNVMYALRIVHNHAEVNGKLVALVTDLRQQIEKENLKGFAESRGRGLGGGLGGGRGGPPAGYGGSGGGIGGDEDEFRPPETAKQEALRLIKEILAKRK